jgi:hypothetical protein
MSTTTGPSTLEYHVPHEPRSNGAGPLSFSGTVVALIGSIATVIISAVAGLLPALTFGVGVAIYLALVTVPDRHGYSTLDRIGRRFGYSRAHHKGSTTLLPGALSRLGAYQAPGTAAASELTEQQDGQGNIYGLLSYRTTGHHVVSFRANPFGLALTDHGASGERVARFQDWLGGLSHKQGLEQAAITIEFSADSLPVLQREIGQNVKDGASDVSKLLFEQMLAKYPTNGIRSQASISLTYATPSSASRTERKSDPAAVMARRLATQLPTMLTELPATGAGPVRLMTPEDVIEDVRCAFNPDDRRLYQQLRARGEQPPVMQWTSVGPTGAVANRTSYWHSGYSTVSWEKTGFTSDQVSVQCLAPLMDLPEGIDVLRITLLYEPISPAVSGLIAEHDHREAHGRLIGQKKPTAKARRDVVHADNTRTAEASGAGLLNFAIIVSASVKDPLPETPDAAPDRRSAIEVAEAAIDYAGPSARLRLRRFDCSQDQAMVQGIGPLGHIAKAHFRISTNFKTGL